jgi:hypothetical protein
MAYDDVLSKLLCIIETINLNIKLTAGYISDRFRSDIPFQPGAYNLSRSALQLFYELRARSMPIRFNKASLFSWLVIVATYISHGKEQILFNPQSTSIEIFENRRLKPHSLLDKSYNNIIEDNKWIEIFKFTLIDRHLEFQMLAQ